MYVRFQGQVPNRGTRSKQGIFQLAFDLCDEPETPLWAVNELTRHLDWLKANLKEPDVLVQDENYRAICWFKSAAHEPMQHVWALKAMLEEFGYYIDVITSSAPGIVIYEDGHQIVAKPFRKTRRKRAATVDSDAPAGL